MSLSLDTPIVKDPDAIIDVGMDWTAYMGSLTDTISVTSWASDPPGLISTKPTNLTGQIATCWLEGGRPGVRYAVRCRVITTAGRQDDRTGTVIVRHR